MGTVIRQYKATPLKRNLIKTVVDKDGLLFQSDASRAAELTGRCAASLPLQRVSLHAFCSAQEGGVVLALAHSPVYLHDRAHGADNEKDVCVLFL